MGEQRHGEKIFFPVQLTTSSTVGNHTRLMPSLSVENEQVDAGQTGRLNPSRETKFSGAYGDRVILIFLLQLTTSTIANLTRLIHTPDSKAIHYFIPSLVALGRGIYISLMIRFLYYNCLGFDLVLWLQHNIIPNTV